MITHSDIARRRSNHRKIMAAIRSASLWWTADEIVKASGVARTVVYRSIKRLLHDNNIEVARDMLGGKQENAQLFRLVSLAKVTDPSEFSSDKELSESIRHRMRERMTEWASRQEPGWSSGEASEYAGVPKGYVDTYLKIQSAIGDYVIVGQRMSKTRHMELLYAYQPKTTPRPDNIFKALIIYGHDEDFQDRVPAESTHYPPGSPQKVEVMAARVGRGESPYHPNDVKVGASGHESDSGCEGLPAIRWVDTAATGRVLRKAIS